MRRISIREKLILYFVMTGYFVIAVTGAFSYYMAREGLLERTFDQLTSVKVTRKKQIENFFNDRARDAQIFARSIEASQILDLLNILNRKTDRSLENPEEGLKGAELFNNYLSQYFKSSGYYSGIIINDGNGLALKYNIEPPKGQPRITFIQEGSKEYDAFPRVSKAFSSPYISDLSKDNPDHLYIIKDINNTKGEISGSVLLEIPAEAINRIMLEQDPMDGLGKTGESYLVGGDELMRSSSRFGRNSIMKTRVNTDGVKRALQGESGISIIKDYRGIRVLSSYGKLDIPGLDWVILAEIDFKEAIVPIRNLRDNILLVSIFIALVLLIVAYLISRNFTRPLIRLTEAANKIGEGNFDVDLPVDSGDEIGQLTQTFSDMSGKLRQNKEQLQEERRMRTRSLLDGQEIERQRLSRELHDGLGQLLIALKLKLESTLDSGETETRKVIRDVQANCDIIIDEVRQISKNLRPAVLNEFGLVNAVRNLVEDLSDHTKVKLSFTAGNIRENIEEVPRNYIFRIAQEAIMNALKHSEANNIAVKLEQKGNLLELLVEDDGKGINEESLAATRGYGMQNIRERCQLLNGEFHMESALEKGTKIRVIIPLKTE